MRNGLDAYTYFYQGVYTSFVNNASPNCKKPTFAVDISSPCKCYTNHW